MSLTQTVKDAYELVNTLANAEQKSQLLGLLLSAREDAFALQEENGKLTDQIRELTEQIKSHDRFEERLEDYSLEQVHMSIVYKHKTKSHWYACPHCVEKHREIHPLQKLGHLHDCPSCEKRFPLYR